jgi:hypothetical protein
MEGLASVSATVNEKGPNRFFPLEPYCLQPPPARRSSCVAPAATAREGAGAGRAAPPYCRLEQHGSRRQDLSSSSDPAICSLVQTAYLVNGMQN